MVRKGYGEGEFDFLSISGGFEGAVVDGGGCAEEERFLRDAVCAHEAALECDLQLEVAEELVDVRLWWWRVLEMDVSSHRV